MNDGLADVEAEKMTGGIVPRFLEVHLAKPVLLLLVILLAKSRTFALPNTKPADIECLLFSDFLFVHYTKLTPRSLSLRDFARALLW